MILGGNFRRFTEGSFRIGFLLVFSMQYRDSSAAAVDSRTVRRVKVIAFSKSELFCIYVSIWLSRDMQTGVSVCMQGRLP